MANSFDLTAEAQRLTKALGGSWHGASGMARCPAHADRIPSLAISPGRTTVLLHCFAGCDFLEIIRAIRSKGALRGGNLPSAADAREVQAKDYGPLARKIWSKARKLPGTLAERYLTSRGLVGPWSDIRFHPRTPIGSGALVTFRPALIAAIRDDSGLVAIHRIALDPSTGRKAIDLENPKLTLGKPKRGAVRLFKAGRTLGIAEGIETAKSAAAMLSIPVWAVLGNERFPQVDIPFDIARLILLPDRGPAGDRGAQLALEAHAREGRDIEILLPPGHYEDWNEADQDRQAADRAGRQAPFTIGL
jgi:hypothetical protein